MPKIASLLKKEGKQKKKERIKLFNYGSQIT